MKIDYSKFLWLTFTLPTVMTGCDDHPTNEHGATDGGHQSPYPSCDAIIKACHMKDNGDPSPVYDCHSVAHGATSDAPCAPKKDECVKTCNDYVVDAGAPDAT